MHSIATLRSARTIALAFVSSGLVVHLVASDARAQSNTDAGASATTSASTGSAGAAEYFTDVALVNQHGEQMRLYSDLIKGRTVIIAPFFTSCTSACPAVARNLVKVQSWLGERLGRDAYILAFTVDPVRDSVDRLRAYAAELDARPGWYFLGGSREQVDLALGKLGQRAATPEGHTNLVIIGNERTGLWKKAFGLADSEALIRVVESVLNDSVPNGGDPEAR